MAGSPKAPVRPSQGLGTWVKEGLVSIFLPVGFPDSVTEDFIRYIVVHLTRLLILAFAFWIRYKTLLGAHIIYRLTADFSQAALLLANRAVLQGLYLYIQHTDRQVLALATRIQQRQGQVHTRF